MKILLDIPDNKVSFFMEVLKNFSFVKKTVKLTDAKAELTENISEAVKEVNLIKAGKLKGIKAKDLLNDL